MHPSVETAEQTAALQMSHSSCPPVYRSPISLWNLLETLQVMTTLVFYVEFCQGHTRGLLFCVCGFACHRLVPRSTCTVLISGLCLHVTSLIFWFGRACSVLDTFAAINTLVAVTFHSFLGCRQVELIPATFTLWGYRWISMVSLSLCVVEILEMTIWSSELHLATCYAA